ncbi:heavy-metal-associated domain-containing protein [Desulfovibrio inopinatus]|uniref:heavy-metal-associated domain-containing protein n=1 Tax=Desulfovibrio inopinatus TaxID=102109 RepID=UPI00041997A1|nr:cation transporter [Desulfovibrio inopinatus]
MKTVAVKGMSCEHCVKSVTEALSKIDGLKNVSVNLELGQASYEEEKPVADDVIKLAISDIGFVPGKID